MTSHRRPGAARRSAAVRTFLIADIRGYTRFTAQYGDEAASRLARTFAEIAGEGVEAWGGELVELRGDEALAVFDSARQAMRCAVELQDAFADETRADASQPLRVGIGLDAGEAVPVDDGYRGAALNLAARLCGSAAGGETLASANIVRLAGPVAGVVIGDLVERVLKGLDRPVEAALIGAVPSVGVREAADAAQADAAPETGGDRSSARVLPAELEPVVPLIGRTEELRWLRWHWRRARHGHGRTVVLSGPPGIGKTRLSAELATLVQPSGAWVSYRPGAQETELEDLFGVTRGPALVVVDDLDAGSARRQQAVADAARDVARLPVLLLVIHRQEAAAALKAMIERVGPPERRLELGPLSPDEVRSIVALYAGSAAEQAPIRQLWDDSRGVPAAAHRAAAVWARSAASQQLGAAAARTEAGRRDLRSAQDELIGDVSALEQISERTRRFAPFGVAAAMTICPYKGLASFDVDDAEYYFGRDRLIAELAAKMVGNPFLGFVGASGSGKSSAIRAGLLPALASGVLPGSERWLQVLMRPGEHPMAALGQALARALPEAPAEGIDPDDPVGDAMTRLGPDRGLVLAVDQFEEVFGATHDEAERGSFIDVLTTDRRGLRVVVTMRADHYGNCAAYPQLARLISATHVLVGPLTPPELASVIGAPAERVGLRVEPELVQVLVADAGSEPAVLPLLSTALLELWQARRAGWLTLDAYRAGGGLHGAIARLAEAAYAQFDPGQAAVARSMFLRLAGPGQGAGVVRRRVMLAELDADGDPAAGRVRKALTDARLLTTGDDFVEVTHEALLREWPRLQAWLEEDAEGRKVRLHLIGAARDWEQRGREPADLYRGARLSAALDWVPEHQVELNATEREFLEASREATQREVERERRTNRRLRGLLTGAGVLLVAAIAAGGFALTQADTARQQAALAEQRQAEADAARVKSEQAARFARSRELAASAVSVIDEDPALSKMLAVAAANIDPSGLDIDSALRRTWAADRQLARWTPPADAPVDLILTSLHPDGRHVAVVTDLGPRDRLSVVDIRDSTTRWTYEPELPQAALSRAFFSDDGARVMVEMVWAPDDDEKGVAPPAGALGLLTFDTQTGRLIQRVDTGPCGADLFEAAGGVGLLRTVPDDREFATDCFTNDFVPPLEAVDLTTGERTLLTGDPLDPVALSADGRYAAFTDDSDRRSYVVDLRTGERVMSLPVSDELGQRDSDVRALSADGSLLLYGDRPPKVYAVPSGKEVAALDQGAGEHFGASFAPTGTLAYLSGRDASLSAWDAATGTLVFRSTAAGGGTPVANATGQVLMDDTTSKTVGLFEGASRGEAGAVETCRGLTFGGQLEINGDVAAYTTDCEVGPATLFMIDVTSLSVVATMADGEGQDIALAPDGRHVASEWTIDHIVQPIRTIDTGMGHPLVTFEGLCEWRIDAPSPPDEAGIDCEPFPTVPFPLWPQRMVYSPDGTMVASMHGGGGPAAWDAATGRLLTAQTLPEGCNPDDDNDPTNDCGGLGAVFTPDNSELIVSTFTCELIALSTDDWTITRRHTFDESVGECGLMALTGYTADGTLVGMSGVGGDGGGWLHRIDPGTLVVTTSDRAHDGSPKGSDISPSGRLIATGASDGVVRIWDAATLDLLHQLSVDDQAQGVAFIDEDRVAVTPSGGGMLVFDLDPASFLATVRASLIRGFTTEECRRFDFEGGCPTLDELRGSTP